MAKSRHEFIVGLVVVIAFIILSMFVLLVSGVSTVLRPGYRLDVYYDYIHGVTTGSAVKYAGVNAGEISDMEVVYRSEDQRPQIRVDIFLEDWVQVRDNCLIYVRGSTPLSEPHLEIICRGDGLGKELRDGDSIQGISPTPIEDLVAHGEVIVKNLKETITKINALLSNEEVGGDVKEILANMAALTKTLNEILSANKSEIGAGIHNFQESMRELDSLLKEIKKGEGTLGRLVGDDALYEETYAFVQEIKARPWRLLKKDKKLDKADEKKKSDEEKKTEEKKG